MGLGREGQDVARRLPRTNLRVVVSFSGPLLAERSIGRCDVRVVDCCAGRRELYCVAGVRLCEPKGTIES